MAHAIVIGAGIGGLTAAVALEQRGWTVTVFERATSTEPVGSGVAIAPNALRALDTLGLGDQVRKLSAMQGEAGIRRADGRWLSRTSAELAAARYGDQVILLLRATLVDLLVSRLSPGALHLDVTVESADPERGTVIIDAGTVQADLVVAADGINSRVRSSLFPDHPKPVYSGVTSWRLIAPGSGVTAAESWGRGLIFGVMPLVDDLVYCYATAAVPPSDKAGRTVRRQVGNPAGHPADRSADETADQTADPAEDHAADQMEHDERAELIRLFGDWHDPIPGLLASAGKVLRHDIYSLGRPLPAFHRGRIALLGDAAHPMTPNLGQGACQAIEDAVVLAHHAGPGAGAALADGLADGLAAYSAARLPRTTRIVRRSATIGRLTQWTNPLAVSARDGLVSLAGKVGPAAAVRQMDAVLAWEPPVS